jgi:hypothetical protein
VPGAESNIERKQLIRKGPDYPSETFRVLKQNEIRRFGELPHARLVLQAWDAMERGSRQ